MLLEVKGKTGRLTESQKRFFEIWGESPVAVVRSAEEAVATVKKLDCEGI